MKRLIAEETYPFEYVEGPLASGETYYALADDPAGLGRSIFPSLEKMLKEYNFRQKQKLSSEKSKKLQDELDLKDKEQQELDIKDKQKLEEFLSQYSKLTAGKLRVALLKQIRIHNQTLPKYKHAERLAEEGWYKKGDRLYAPDDRFFTAKDLGGQFFIDYVDYLSETF